jgi:tetratricopeptide (TPR) repeat protein
MFIENLKIFSKTYFRPLAAMSEMIDRGSLPFILVGTLALSIAFQIIVTQKLYDTYQARYTWAEYGYATGYVPGYGFSHNYFERSEYDEDTPPPVIPLAPEGESGIDIPETSPYVVSGLEQIPFIGNKYGRWLFSFAASNLFSTIIGLSVFYVPGLILLVSLFGLTNSFEMALRRDYGTLWSCVLLAWAVAHLPFLLAAIALAGQAVAPEIYLALWLGSSLYFGLLMVFALRAVFGLDYGPALGLVVLSWLPLSLGNQLFKVVSPYMCSPFILFYLWLYFRSGAGDMSYSYRQKRDFRRFLENATVNPHDADAHCQLGLIYLQRRQETEAWQHFTRAIEIDPEEIDARFQLGRLCRERGQLQEAIDHFGVVVAQDAKYGQHEVWREIGATYLAANMLPEAKESLTRYVENRPFDPEGLYHLGQTLLKTGETAEAREMFQRCLEAVQTMPYYRRHEGRRWRKLAQTQLAAR